MLHKWGAAQRCAARNEGVKSNKQVKRPCVARLSVRWGDLAGVPLCAGLDSQCLGDSGVCARRSALSSRQIRCSAIEQSAGGPRCRSCMRQLPFCRVLLLWRCSCLSSAGYTMLQGISRHCTACTKAEMVNSKQWFCYISARAAAAAADASISSRAAAIASPSKTGCGRRVYINANACNHQVGCTLTIACMLSHSRT